MMRTLIFNLILAVTLFFGMVFLASSNTALAATPEGVKSPISGMLLAFDGFDDDGGGADASAPAMDEGPASDEATEGLMGDGSGASASGEGGELDPDADPGFSSQGFDPDRE